MAGRCKLPAETALHVGHAVLRARAGGMLWKTLEVVYDRHRSMLWRYAMAALTNDAAAVAAGETHHREINDG